MTDHLKVKPSIFLKVKREANNCLESIVFENNGIIYGGYVRDSIIVDEYTKRFHKENPYGDLCNQFYDKNISPETLPRLIIPSDMDVCFHNMDDADNFISAVRRIPQFRNVYINDTSAKKYYSPKILCVKSISIYLTVGEIPFISRGKTVIMSMDVVIPKPNIDLEPPFNNLDMLCNGFIKVKQGYTEDAIRFSKNTGTCIDFYSLTDRIQVISGIIKDLVEFKTYLAFSQHYTPQNAKRCNVVAMRRVMKMHRKTHKWSFRNMPYKIEKSVDAACQDNCCVCFSNIEVGEEKAYTVTHTENGDKLEGAKMHHMCFLQYLYHQQKDYVIGDDVFIFKCPYRNPVDFRKCISDISTAYL